LLAGIVALLPENLSYDREAGFRLERVGNNHDAMCFRPPEDTPKPVGEQADPGSDASATCRTVPADCVDRRGRADASGGPVRPARGWATDRFNLKETARSPGFDT
jgi:hypothetical protein